MKPFIRIDNRLVMVMEKPQEPNEKDYQWNRVGMSAEDAYISDMHHYEGNLAIYNSRPSYPINPADLDKFEFGKQYWEGKDFEVKALFHACESVHSSQWGNKPTAFPIHILSDKDNEAKNKKYPCIICGAMTTRKDYEVCMKCFTNTPSPSNDRREEKQEEELWAVGDKAEKLKGYKFDCTIVAVFKNLSGEKRLVAQNQDGILHIFNETQLNKINHKS